MVDGGWRMEKCRGMIKRGWPNADEKIPIKKCGWQNADGKMQKSKCGWQNVNDNMGMRENKFTMFSQILSCKIKPREFKDRNIFYAGYEKKWNWKRKHEKSLIKDSSHSDSVPYHIEGLWLRLISMYFSALPLPKTSIFKISKTLLRSASPDCTVVDKFAGHTERSQQNACEKESLPQLDCTRAMESSDSDDSPIESIFVSKTWVNGFNLNEWTSTGSSSHAQDNETFGKGR